MAANGYLIDLEGIDFAYDPARPVLAGLDLKLGRAERIGLIGPNGCGKSTLLHIMVGLLRPSSGQVTILGQERRKERDFHEARVRVGFLFQDSDDQLFCPTVAEDVAFGPLNLGKTLQEAEAIVAETLARVGLDGFEDRITYHLSSGEKRLVALATVLAMRPEALLLDEPTAGLDEDAQDRITTLLLELGLPMIVASHDRTFLGTVATRLVRIEQGAAIDVPPPG